MPLGPGKHPLLNAVRRNAILATELEEGLDKREPLERLVSIGFEVEYEDPCLSRDIETGISSHLVLAIGVGE